MTNSEQGAGELPWSERINQLSIHPEAASMRDIAKMAGELSEANWNLSALQAKVADLENSRKALRDNSAEVFSRYQGSRVQILEAVLMAARADLEIVSSFLPDLLPDGMTFGKRFRLESIKDTLVKINEALRPDQGETGI